MTKAGRIVAATFVVVGLIGVASLGIVAQTEHRASQQRLAQEQAQQAAEESKRIEDEQRVAAARAAAVGKATSEPMRVGVPATPKMDKAKEDKLTDAWLRFVEGIDGEAKADADLARYRAMGVPLGPTLEFKQQMIEWQKDAVATLAAYSTEDLRATANPILEMPDVSVEGKEQIKQILGKP